MIENTDGVKFFAVDKAEPLIPVPGVEMRGVFGAGASFTLVRLATGAEVPLHSHPHEQMGMVLEGVQVLIVGGREYHVGAKQAYVLPGGMEHGGRGGPDGCLAIDIFIPARNDYRVAAAPELARSCLIPGRA